MFSNSGKWVRRCAVIVVWLLATVVQAADFVLPLGSPEEVGLSTERLGQLDAMIQERIDSGELLGAVTLVARRGKLVHNSALGLMDKEAGQEMTVDTMFKIASMTKPVTAVAIMMLVEEGQIRLSDPVSRYIPEFSELTVAKALPGQGPFARGQAPEYLTVPMDREITIADLLSHTSGLGSGAMSNNEIGKIPRVQAGDTLADYIPQLGSTALEFQPDSRWAYSAFAGFDTLGHIVEIASGIPFDQFLRQRIFDPLGMNSITFWPESDDWSPVAVGYRPDADGILQKSASPIGRSSPTYFAGSSGLMGSGEDYIPMGMLLANGGELNGLRLLSRKSVEMMTAVHVPDTFAGRRAGEGFGLGVRVVTDHATRGTLLSNGTYGWFGATGTYFVVDPVEELVGVLMVATPNGEISSTFETMIAQSIVD